MRDADLHDVSVVLTAYNVERDIATAVQSAWDTLALLDGLDGEVIVVDDGSTDRTGAALDLMARTWPARPLRLVRFSRNTVGGVGIAANAGLNLARGRIVVFLDGDDWVMPEALAPAIRRIAAENLDMLVTGCREYWNDGGDYTEWPEHAAWAALEAGAAGLEARRALLKMAPFPWRKLYRRGFLDAEGIRFPEGDFFFEDNPFHWECAVKAARWDWTPAVTHIHRRARAGQSLERQDRGYLQILTHHDTIRAMLEAAGQGAAHAGDLADWLMHHVPWMAGRLAAEDWNDLYDGVQARLAAMGAGAVAAALGRAQAQGAGRRLLTALAAGDRAAFMAEYGATGGRDVRAQDRG